LIIAVFPQAVNAQDLLMHRKSLDAHGGRLGQGASNQRQKSSGTVSCSFCRNVVLREGALEEFAAKTEPHRQGRAAAQNVGTIQERLAVGLKSCLSGSSTAR